jgi:hypothetical protein
MIPLLLMLGKIFGACVHTLAVDADVSWFNVHVTVERGILVPAIVATKADVLSAVPLSITSNHVLDVASSVNGLVVIVTPVTSHDVNVAALALGTVYALVGESAVALTVTVATIFTVSAVYPVA